METCSEHAPLKKIAEETHAMVTEIYKSLRGDLEKPGWLTRIEGCEKNIKIYNRVFVWFISIVGAGAIVFFWALLNHTIELVIK